MGYFYPAGDEQTLIQQVTGRCVPERGLPSDVGCVVDNVGTVLNIADALEGKAVTEKYLSVVGEVEHPIQLRVPIGTPVLECVKAAHPTVSDFALIMGGPMMGKQLTEPGGDGAGSGDQDDRQHSGTSEGSLSVPEGIPSDGDGSETDQECLSSVQNVYRALSEISDRSSDPSEFDDARAVA